MSEPVDLIRDGDGGQLRPEQGDQLAAEQDAQITGLPQGRDVNEDPSLRRYHLRKRKLQLNDGAVGSALDVDHVGELPGDP